MSGKSACKKFQLTTASNLCFSRNRRLGDGLEFYVCRLWRPDRAFWTRQFKRYIACLVELLTRMGHPPEQAVKLVLESLTEKTTTTMEKVAMTSANRRAIYAAGIARDK